jgi:uncharacterized membrane protein YkvI
MWINVLALGGATMAFAAGSGFASGQEILQFFSAFGLWGSLGAGAVAWMVFLWISTTVIVDGCRIGLDSSVGIYRYYCGNAIGNFLEWCMPLLMFLFLTVMISGAGATFHEYLGLSPTVGRAVMAVLTLLTVLLGLSGLVQIISTIGIGIIFVSVSISIVSLFGNWEGLLIVDQVFDTVKIPRATFAEAWWISGLLYGAFNVVTALPFLAGLGRQSVNKRAALLTGTFGGTSYISAGILMNLALLGSIEQVYDKQIPFLWIANSIFPAIGAVFSIMLLAGIYTTAVPMLWSICDLLGSSQKRRSILFTAIPAVVFAFFAGQLPFAGLVGIVYPGTGLIGVVLLACMIYKKYGKAS